MQISRKSNLTQFDNLVLMGRAVSGASGKRFKKATPQRPPVKQERALVNLMGRVFGDIRAIALSVVEKPLTHLADEWVDDFREMTEAMREETRKVGLKYAEDIGEIGDDVQVFNSSEWRRVMNGVMGVSPMVGEPWLGPVMSTWKSNVLSLITNVSEKVYSDVGGVVSRGFLQGKRASSVAKEISAVFSSTKSRCRLIASDQINKLNASITRRRQNDAGVTDYIWQSSRDERVRGASNPKGKYKRSRYDHWARDGQKFSYDNPPEDGNPSEPVRCRCRAIADFSSIEEKIMAVENRRRAML